MHAIKTLSPEDVAAFLLQVVVLLAFAHVGGELMRRFRQPALIGNIFGGMLLGPSVLGHWFPGLQQAVFRPEQSQSDMLAAITWVGLLLFLMEAGFEVRLDLLRRNAASCVIVSAGGLIVPMISGFLLGQYLPAAMLVQPGDRLVLSLFLAVAMSISALPPLAMILRDKDMLRENVGQISLGAAMMDDVVAWILVGITTSLHVSGTFSAVSVVKSAGAAVLFLAGCFLIGRPLLRRFIDWHNSVAPGPAPQLSLLIICGLAGSLITSWLGLESILGIFVAGILFGSASGLQKNAVHSLSLVVSSFLAPLYFGLAGLRLNIWSVYEGNMSMLLLAVIAVACIGKLLGVYLGAWVCGLPRWERLAMGFGMNARGGTEIIIATLGLSIGLLTREMFSIIVVMAIVTVILSGPTMAWALSKVHRDDKTVDAALPQFIYEEALEEPPVALNLVEQEELRLASRLKSYTRAMRTDAGSPERAAAAGIHEPFVAVAGVAENFLQQLATQSLCPGTSARLISLENRLRLLRYIEESVRGLFTSSVRMPAGTALRSHLDSYTEGLDFLLDRMLEALAQKDATAAATFVTSTEGRSDILEGVRGDYLRSAADSHAPDQAVLFEVASGFEQTMWMLHRFALLVPQA